MQKNRKRLGTIARRSNQVALPQVINMDILGGLLDENLIARIHQLESDRNRAVEADQDTYPWEVELAYARREQQLRRARREAHEAYTRELEKEIVESEVNLPSADLDNSRFLELYQ